VSISFAVTAVVAGVKVEDNAAHMAKCYEMSLKERDKKI